MRSQPRSALRTSEPESAKDGLAPIGARLAHVRARSGLSQAAFAETLGSTHKTYARWERGIREIGVDGLQALISQGWNANWLLTGIGPERIEDMPDPVRDGQPAADWSSSPRQMEALALAIEEVDRLQAAQRRRWPPQRRARAIALMTEILAAPGDELPTADIVTLGSKLGLDAPE